LVGVVRDERPLQRVQTLAITITVGEPFDRDDLAVLVRDGEGEAAVGAPAVEQDGTGAALAVVAALLNGPVIPRRSRRASRSVAPVSTDNWRAVPSNRYARKYAWEDR